MLYSFKFVTIQPESFPNISYNNSTNEAFENVNITTSRSNVKWDKSDFLEYLILIWIIGYFFQIIREVSYFVYGITRSKTMAFFFSNFSYLSKIFIYAIEKIWSRWSLINFFGCLVFFIALLLKNVLEKNLENHDLAR